jgi:hypothetical protein
MKKENTSLTTLKNLSIIYVTIILDISQENRIIERLNNLIMNKTKTLLKNINLSEKLYLKYFYVQSIYSIDFYQVLLILSQLARHLIKSSMINYLTFSTQNL